jgi:hypothetical protein
MYFSSSYFGPDGLEYNMMRVPIGGADFSTHPYTYNEYPLYDIHLTNFSLTNEDLFLKVSTRYVYVEHEEVYCHVILFKSHQPTKSATQWKVFFPQN